jgi:prophage regulatory protein
MAERSQEVSTDEQNAPAYRLLDADDLRAKGIKYSRMHLYRLMKAGRFPKTIRVGDNRNAWIEAEVDAYIATRIAERDAEAA